MAVALQLVVFVHFSYFVVFLHSSSLGTCQHIYCHNQRNMEERRSLVEEPNQGHHLAINITHISIHTIKVKVRCLIRTWAVVTKLRSVSAA